MHRARGLSRHELAGGAANDRAGTTDERRCPPPGATAAVEGVDHHRGTGDMTPPAPTGWCHACGLVCTGAFCRPRCRQAWEIEQRVEARHVVRRGKRENYGPRAM